MCSMRTEKLSNVVLNHGCTICSMWNARTHVHTDKFSTKHTSVGLAHTHPCMQSCTLLGRSGISNSERLANYDSNLLTFYNTLVC